VQWRVHDLEDQLERAGLDLDTYLTRQDRTREQLEEEARTAAERAVKAQLVLDAVAAKEELNVDEAELTDQVVRRAQRAGVDPSAYIQRLMAAEQLPALLGDILRGKALATVLNAAVITDASGRPVDLDALREDPPVPEGELADDAVEVGEPPAPAAGPTDISLPAV
jgi:trigger factor